MKEVIIFYLVLTLKWIQSYVLDPILDLTFGFTTKFGTKTERLKSVNYAQSAQKVKIWARGAYSVGTFHSPKNFLYTHKSYFHPNEVLSKDNITLQGVVSKNAWFCVTEEIVDVNDVSKFPFVWIAQYLMATELVRIISFVHIVTARWR